MEFRTYFVLIFIHSLQAHREGVQKVRLHRPPPPTDTRGLLFLLIRDLKQSEVGVLFYSNLLIVYSKREVKEVTSLTNPFH